MKDSTITKQDFPCRNPFLKKLRDKGISTEVHFSQEDIDEMNKNPQLYALPGVPYDDEELEILSQQGKNPAHVA
ncbi:MAG: hypothetical protein FWB96_07595 [Defluviitaleaceae bacterium]|nr:hypothetical protein [Defluviitaleaceae bacterium]MCL2262788.1 hypothetical protein [Defluviitaleaceae bacterium]